MDVKLLTSKSSIEDMQRFAALAALTCHGNADKDVDPKELLQRIIKMEHFSILEHIYLTYSIKGISRALLQELARHRHITLSVESTRHTLKKKLDDVEWLRAFMDTADIDTICCLRTFAKFYRDNEDISNDELKYYLPEFWPTNLIMTTNVRELRHILKLRTAPNALMEFRELGVEMFSRVPDDFKYLLEDCVYIGG